MRLRRHPSREELLRWLNGDLESLDPHLATCNRCAAILESLEAEGGATTFVAAPGAPTINQALAAVYQAPVDLPQRVEDGVVARLDGLAMLGVMADLFRAGFETGGLLLRETRPDDRGDSSPRDPKHDDPKHDDPKHGEADGDN